MFTVLQITEVELVHCNIFNNDYQKDSIQELCVQLLQTNHLVKFLIFHPKVLLFLNPLINNFHM